MPADNTSNLSVTKFARLARDAAVSDAKLTKADIDLIFVRASQTGRAQSRPPSRITADRQAPVSRRPAGQKMLDFDQFLEALYEMAAKKYGRAAAEPRSYAEPTGRRGLPMLLSLSLIHI